jgi:hypothetical protein
LPDGDGASVYPSPNIYFQRNLFLESLTFHLSISSPTTKGQKLDLRTNWWGNQAGPTTFRLNGAGLINDTVFPWCVDEECVQTATHCSTNCTTNAYCNYVGGHCECVEGFILYQQQCVSPNSFSSNSGSNETITIIIICVGVVIVVSMGVFLVWLYLRRPQKFTGGEGGVVGTNNGSGENDRLNQRKVSYYNTLVS